MKLSQTTKGICMFQLNGKVFDLRNRLLTLILMSALFSVGMAAPAQAFQIPLGIGIGKKDKKDDKKDKDKKDKDKDKKDDAKKDDKEDAFNLEILKEYGMKKYRTDNEF